MSVADFKIELGAKVQDRLSGLCGVVTARAEFITGCRQYSVQPPVSDAGEFRATVWLDEDRLLPVPAADASAGGPQDVPHQSREHPDGHRAAAPPGA